jgi:TPM domain
VQLFTTLKRIFIHRWTDSADVRRALPPAALERLKGRVAASEARHSGEIRFCVEAGLPMGYLWRSASARERAVAMFGKLRMWDTAHNNGVLIYLLLAERRIELVADRGINAHVDSAAWQDMVSRMSAAFKEARFEDGLTQALEEVSAVLVQHFGTASGAAHVNELPNAVDLR